jgi:hypothetical protein
MQVVIIAIASNTLLVTLRPVALLKNVVFLISFILSPYLLLKAASTTALPVITRLFTAVTRIHRHKQK